ncbi:MAG: GHKL domain-containing protein [Saprospiraceae bacterium]|nr:GHKL domain-containing protein [Saprospiraceae bacterium]
MALRYAAIILFGISLLAVFLGQKPVRLDGHTTELSEEINIILERDSSLVMKYFGSENDKQILSSLSSSPFYLEVYRQDSIVFWNDNTFISENPQTEFKRITRWGDSLNYAIVSLNLNQTDYHNKIFNKWKFYDVNSKPDFDKIQIRNSVLSLDYFDGARIQNYWKKMAWIALFGSIVLISIILLFIIKSKISTSFRSATYPTILLIMILGVYGGLHGLPVFYSYFAGNTYLTIAEHAGINIYQMIAGLWAFGVLIYMSVMIFRHSTWVTAKTTLMAWLIGFYTFFIFGVSVFVIEKWVLHSDVNLEIESLLQFNYLSFLVIISLLTLMMMIFHSTQLMFEWMHQQQLKGYYKAGILVTGWIGAYILLRMAGWLNVPAILFFVFIASYTLILDAYTEKKEKKITYLIWWMMMFSGFLAVTLFYFGLNKDVQTRQRFMSAYYHDFDPAIVTSLEMLNDSLVADDVFTKIASMDPNTMLDNKDLSEYIGRHADSPIEISTELFNKQRGTTLFSNHFSDYYKLNESYLHSRAVGKNIYHHPFENYYYSRFEIAGSDSGATSWYLFIIYKVGKSTSIHGQNYKDFGYAVFHHDQLIEKRENTQASPDFKILSSLMETNIEKGYSYVVSKPSDHYRIVSWKKVSGLIKPISLFSFMFTLIGLIVILFTWINTKYDFLPDNLGVKFGSSASLKTKIQFAIILLIVVSFLIIGVITALYFKNLIVANQKSKNIQETESILNNINTSIQNIDEVGYGLNYINSKLKDLSYIHNKALSLYDYTGKLVGATSDENMHLRVSYNIWSGINYDQPEDHEYVPLFMGENKVTRKIPFAFIDIDHQSYNSSSNILDFLSTILNAYIFLFLIAGAIAITISNSITQPLSILAEKLKKFKLGKTNELLEWNSNDEIGALIHDYNNLTLEVEKSAGLLAKTERDIAWREMAKQVAHEIKNPLTPMKLNIQYLEKTAKEYPERAHEMIPRVSSVLIEQIDNLSQIANEFSNFAAMPQASNEKFILNEVVETIHDLFRKRDDMDINMIEPIDDLYIFADKNHLVRILNNLLKNAIQAIPEKRRGKIEIELSRKGNEAIIRISDNGTGIPDHMKDKVFTPNFTTKSSGTGLGLAISANMIDSFNGKIYFETQVGNGTDFYVSIPLMRIDEPSRDETRVTLED